MPFLFLLFFLLGRLLFHVAGFPDVDFRFRARLEPFDVLAVRVDQQHGDDEREHGTRWFTFGEMSVKMGKLHPATIEASDT